MIIFDDFGIQTRSSIPNADWTNGEAMYVVDDNSELAEKILKCNMRFTPIEDNYGNLTDIIPDERYTTGAEFISPVLSNRNSTGKTEDNNTVEVT
jgi:hypothetical protein